LHDAAVVFAQPNRSLAPLGDGTVQTRHVRAQLGGT
jgi:hypothetical protein